MRVAVTTSSFGEFSDKPLAMLRDKGLDIVLNPHGRALTEDETIHLLAGCVGVAAGTEPYTRRVMQALPELKVIARCGAGVDSVDLVAAAELGITVNNTPDAPTRAVAELVIGYAFTMARNLARMDADMKAGTWKKRMGCLLQGKPVGVVGYGRIGKSVATLFSMMGCDVAFSDPFVQQGDHPKYELPELLARSELITLHCAKPAHGNALLGEAELASMPRGSFVINAARGGLIDENALIAALESGHIAGAALDVFSKEPYTGPLCGQPNALLTPHVGSYAREARINQETETVANLLHALEQVTPATA